MKYMKYSRLQTLCAYKGYKTIKEPSEITVHFALQQIKSIVVS